MACGIEHNYLNMYDFAPRYKICKSCLISSNPANDYAEVRAVVSSYLKFAQSFESKSDEENDLLE
jgi:hypothetical protein